jgi:hypothetical protein
MEYQVCLKNSDCRDTLSAYGDVSPTIDIIDLSSNSDRIMEAVGYYVDKHMAYVSDSGIENEQSALWTIGYSGSAKQCANSFCGDCEDMAILRNALIRALGVSWKCAFVGDHYDGYWGGGHSFNIVVYKNAYRILDQHTLGYFFYHNRWDQHIPQNVWNDRVGEFWCPDWIDNTGECDKTDPKKFTWNYLGDTGGQKCPPTWSGEETYHTDVCP